MRVTGARVTSYSCPVGRGSAGRHATHGCLVELAIDSELQGIAVLGPGSTQAIERFAVENLVGEDPRAVPALWRRMMEAARHYAGLPQGAIAALDLALWDLKAKACAEPLWKTLGGARPRANVHAGAAALDSSDEASARWYARMAGDHGLRGAKLRLGPDAGRDRGRLAAMRTALRTNTAAPTLVVDAQQAWTPEHAISRLRELEREFDLAWVEGATSDEDCAGHRQISDAIYGAIAIGAGFAAREEFLPHFQHRSADVIQLDIGLVGITGALTLADAAFGYELPVTLVEAPGNIHVQLAGAMPYLMSVEVVDPESQWPAFTSDVRIEAGWATAGDAPGHGLVLNRAALEREVSRGVSK